MDTSLMLNYSLSDFCLVEPRSPQRCRMQEVCRRYAVVFLFIEIDNRIFLRGRSADQLLSRLALPIFPASLTFSCLVYEQSFKCKPLYVSLFGTLCCRISRNYEKNVLYNNNNIDCRIKKPLKISVYFVYTCNRRCTHSVTFEMIAKSNL